MHPSWLEVLGERTRVELFFALALAGEASASELASLTGAGKQTLRRHLAALVALGLAEEFEGQSDGLTPGRPAARFRLGPEARRSALALARVLERPLAGAPR